MGRLPGCSSACWIAGPYRCCHLRWRAVGRARAGTAAGGSPSAPLCLRVCARAVADRQWRGLAGHGVARLSAACQLVSITVDAHLAKWQSARTGPLGLRVKLVARLSREPRRAATVKLPFSLPLACSLAAAGRLRWAWMRRRLQPKRLGRRVPGAGRFRTRAPVSAGRAHGVITDHHHPGRGSGPARAVLCPSDGSRTAGLEGAR
jgi:hypothetical protein